jgi:hypothetical protein
MKTAFWMGLLLMIPTIAVAQQSVTNPHGDLELGCESCHGAEGWVPAHTEDFGHAKTGFELERAHEGLACTDCHTDLQFGSAAPECASCHSDVHLGELGQHCGRCHSTHSFVDLAQFRRMHREASFDLTGAHAGADCRDCHVPRPLGDLQYLGTDAECIDCHRDDYEGTTEPDHVQDDFLLECDACHGTATWSNAIFNHELQLGTGLVCAQCHQGDYDRAPNHTSSNYPLECQICHNTRSWGADFGEHDTRYFPIFRGRHAGEWDDCSECHTVPGDFRAFDCLNCHPHDDQAETDGHHREEPTYAYLSEECYRCHRNGRAED